MLPLLVPPIPIEAGSAIIQHANRALNTAPLFNRGFDPKDWVPTLLHAEGWFEFVNPAGLQVLISINGRLVFHVPAA